MNSLALEATWWAREFKVEAVVCWLPDFNQVCDGVHTITALGIDGMAVNIIVRNEVQSKYAAYGLAVEQAHLAYLGRLLANFRRQETAGEFR